MMGKPRPLPDLEEQQALAADPRAHAALSASAGSGKTQVLTARVLRLLLDDVPPESILCLTFTKAAAAEMANRLTRQLAQWVRMPAKALRKDLDALRDTPERVERARRLFARVLQAPGGLRIMTIHSFAQSLLESFPAEANVTPGLKPIEGRAEQELIRRTLATLLVEAEQRGEQALFADLQCLSLRLGEEGAVNYLRACAESAQALRDVGEPAAYEPLLRARFGLPEGSAEQLVLAQCEDDAFDCGLLRKLLDANRSWDTASGRTICANIAEWLEARPETRVAGLAKLADKLVTKDFRAYKVSPKQVAACADYEQLVQQLAAILKQINDLRAGLANVREMAAGLRAGRIFADAYDAAKRAAGVGDFGDMIRWARALLAQPGMGEWVRFKLDRRIDHILVDEAQDTNADQWAIVKALADEFFTGAPQADARQRTIMMVGDFKQAIFAFQGTDPAEFDQARNYFRERSEALADAAGESFDPHAVPVEFRDLSIAASYRSAQPVLDAVNAVIDELGFAAMGLPDVPGKHVACTANASLPGTVELLAPFEPDPQHAAANDNGDNGEEGWIDEPRRQYAKQLAAQVRRWLDEAPVLASTGRPLQPGDILILVRSRKDFAALLVARLFEAHVRVAGVDRLHLREPLAIRDLISAIAFAIQPLHDLKLAELLVSPLIGWSQQQLFELAFERERGKSLWQALGERASTRQDFADARAALGQLLSIADYDTPHRFLEAVLSGPLGGRRKIYARLGLAARDPIDALLAAALDFEREEAPSLEHFLAWFERGDVHLSRDAAAAANEVRVMTVHGAKGLEAPWVILADATADPTELGPPSPPLVVDVNGTKLPLVRPKSADLIGPLAQIAADEAARDLEEHWRLLYVGMTRAVERLVIGGIKPKKMPAASWYGVVERALTEHLESKRHKVDLWGSMLRFTGSVATRRTRSSRGSASGPPLELTAPAIPQWANEPAPPEARPPKPLAPSAIGVDNEAAPAPSAAMRAAALRGTLIHALLDRLVGVVPGDRPAAARRWLERSTRIGDAAARDEIVAQVCAILSVPQFAPLFEPGSLGEAPLAATLPDGRVIAGTVDRLLVEEHRISVIDFKTGKVPTSDVQIPAGHRTQMAAYADALRVIFPGREVRSALLYTAGPRLFELAG